MSDIPTLPSDRQLVGAVRSGNDAAWAELMGRHEPSVRAVRAGSRAERRAVAQCLRDLREIIETTDEPLEGDMAIRAFRPRAIAACSGGMFGPTPLPPGDLEIDPRDIRNADGSIDDDELLAMAFSRLPDSWQTVLWHTHVEQLTAAEVSPLVGRTVNEVGELLTTAERGLADAFVLEYLAVGPLDPSVETIVPLLSGHVRGALPPHEARRVQAHLADDADDATGDEVAGAETGDSPAPGDGVDATETGASSDEDDDALAPPAPRRHTATDSRRLVAIIASLGDRLPGAVAPRLTGLSVEDHRAALGTTSRSFGTAALFAHRSNRAVRFAEIGAVAAIVIALLGAVYLIRKPFENNGGDSGPSTTSVTVVTPETTDAPATTVESTVPEPTVPETTAPETTVPETTTPAPTTTELILRPDPTGPANDIELVFTAGPRPLPFAPTPNELEVEVTSPAPIFAGGTGTVDVAITNTSNGDIDTSFEMLIPQGVLFEALVDGDAECATPGDDSPFCNVAVAEGETVVLALRFGLESATVGRLTVGGELVGEPLDAQIVSTRNLVHSSVAHGGITMIGNTLMTCADDAAAAIGIDCADVRAGVGDTVNRWDVPMEYVRTATESGLPNSSSATLALPEGATVAAAYLYWSGDLDERGRSIPDDGSREIVTLAAPDGEPITIEADRIVLGDVDATQYLGSADVTDIVRAGGAGDYLVGDVTSIEIQGSYAGWSLVVVYDDEAAPRRQRIVTKPFTWVAPVPKFEYSVEIPVPYAVGSDASLSVLAFEGELGFIPERMAVDGEITGGENIFDGTIAGERSPAYVNNLGVDIDAYDLSIDTPDGILPISATSEKDGIRVAVLALTVDLKT